MLSNQSPSAGPSECICRSSCAKISICTWVGSGRCDSCCSRRLAVFCRAAQSNRSIRFARLRAEEHAACKPGIRVSNPAASSFDALLNLSRRSSVAIRLRRMSFTNVGSAVPWAVGDTAALFISEFLGNVETRLGHGVGRMARDLQAPIASSRIWLGGAMICVACGMNLLDRVCTSKRAPIRNQTRLFIGLSTCPTSKRPWEKLNDSFTFHCRHFSAGSWPTAKGTNQSDRSPQQMSLNWHFRLQLFGHSDWRFSPHCHPNGPAARVKASE